MFVLTIGGAEHRVPSMNFLMLQRVVPVLKANPVDENATLLKSADLCCKIAVQLLAPEDDEPTPEEADKAVHAMRRKLLGREVLPFVNVVSEILVDGGLVTQGEAQAAAGPSTGTSSTT